jgi:hypothetical protein
MIGQSLQEKLLDDCIERDERTGWNRYRTDDLPRIDNQMRTERVPMVRGATSLTLLYNKQRYVHRDVWPANGPQRARLYARHIFKTAIERHGPYPKDWMVSRGIVPFRKGDDDLLQDACATLFFDPQLAHELRNTPLACIDIKSAYFQLYRWWSLDMTWRPNEDRPWFGTGILTFDRHEEWEADKEARNALWGTFSSSNNRLRVIKGNETHHLPFRNVNLARSLTRYMMDTMQAIAQEVRSQWPTPLIHTDAYFVPLSEVDSVRAYLADVWRLPTSIKGHGDANLLHAGSYKIGDKTTKNYPSAPGGFSSTLQYVPPVLVETLIRARHWRAPAITANKLILPTQSETPLPLYSPLNASTSHGFPKLRHKCQCQTAT